MSETIVVYTTDGNPGSTLVTARAIQGREYDMHAYPNVSILGDDPIDLYIAVPSDWEEGKHFADWYRSTVEDETPYENGVDEDGSMFEVINFSGYLVRVILP